MNDYRWCNLRGHRHSKLICEALRDDRTGKRSRCGWLNEEGGCDHVSKEEREEKKLEEKKASAEEEVKQEQPTEEKGEIQDGSV